MINFKHLHYFWVSARQGGIARASEVLHITPQTISSQISLLEENLGKPLFQKAGRNLKLTDTGRMALKYADEIFALGDELETSIRNTPQSLAPLFRIGISDAVPKSIAYRLLEPAMSIDTPVRFQCRENSLESLLGELALHRLDLVIADGPMPEGLGVKGYNHSLGECGISFLAAPVLVAQLTTEFPGCLNNTPFLFPSPLSSLNAQLHQWLDQYQIYPKFFAEFDDSALMKAFGQAGKGVFMVPSAIASEIQQQFRVEQIGSTEEIRATYYAISTERRLSNPAVIAINRSAQNWLKT